MKLLGGCFEKFQARSILALRDAVLADVCHLYVDIPNLPSYCYVVNGTLMGSFWNMFAVFRRGSKSNPPSSTCTFDHISCLHSKNNQYKCWSLGWCLQRYISEQQNENKKAPVQHLSWNSVIKKYPILHSLDVLDVFSDQFSVGLNKAVVF